MKRRNTTLSLVTLEAIDQALTAAGGVYALEISLHYPRPNVAERATTRTLGEPRQQWDFTSAPLARQLLFKETLEGPVGITCRLLRSDANEALNQWLADLLGGAIGAAGAFAAAAQPTPARPLIRDLTGSLSGTLDRKDGRQILATASTSLPKLTDKKPRAPLTLDLIANGDFTRRQIRRSPRAKKTTETRLITQGQPLGRLSLVVSGLSR